MKKLTKVLSVVLAVALIGAGLVACGGSEGGSAAGGSGEIFIGATGPLTGDASSYGISVQQGAQLAVEEINANGGVNGLTLKFDIKDDKAAAADAATAYDQLFDAGMQVSLGSVTSGSCEAFGQRAAEDGLFFLTPSASAASVIETGDTAFRVCFGDPDQGVLAAQELTSKYKKIGCIYDTSDTYSSGIYEAFEGEMKNLGVEYTVCTFDADNKKDFSAQVETLKDCDVIFCPFYYTEASTVARVCAQKELDEIVLFGCDGFDGIEPLLEETVKNPINYITPFDVTSTDEKVANFVAAYNEKYESDPDQFAADGYDAVYTIAECLTKAEVKDAKISAEDLGKIMVETITGADFSYAGVTGGMKWDASGACTKVPVIKVIQ